MLSPFLQRKIVLAYYRFDQNKDGLVSADDSARIAQQIAQTLNLAPGSEQYEQVLSSARHLWDVFWQPLDTDGDNTVSLAESLASGEGLIQHPNVPELVQGESGPFFSALDLDGDGKVTLREFTVFLQALGGTEAEARTAFEHLDRNGDGTLAPDELGWAWGEYYSATDPAAPGNYFYGTL